MTYTENRPAAPDLTRREFLSMAGAGVGAVALSPLLAESKPSVQSCASGSADSKTLNIKDRLFEAIRTSNADYTDIRLETCQYNNLNWTGTINVDEATPSNAQSGYIRVLQNGHWGASPFSSLDDLTDGVVKACSDATYNASHDAEPPETLPEIQPVDAIVRSSMQPDFLSVSHRRKVELMGHYAEVIDNAGPIGFGMQYGDRFRTVYFGSSTGSFFAEETSRMILAITVFAKNGASARERIVTTQSFDDLFEYDKMVTELALTGVRLNDSVPCEPGTRTMILDPMLAGVFIAHEGYGHLFEGASFYHFPELKEMLAIGTQLGVKGLNIIDDGTIPGLAGTQIFDDEGTRSRKTYLVRDGKVAGYMHSLQTAAAMGHRPTGNGRVLWAWEFPFSGMTNTYVDSGDATFEDLLSGIDDGIYACGAMGGKNFTTRKDFYADGMYGYRIINGKVAKDRMVTGIRLHGSVLKTLHQIEGIEKRDVSTLMRMGYCSGGRVTGMGSPHIRIRDLEVMK